MPLLVLDTNTKVDTVPVANDFDREARLKNSRRQASKKFAAKKKLQDVTISIGFERLHKELCDKGLLDSLSFESKEFINYMLTKKPNTKDPKQEKSIFNILFGDSPSVGDSITLKEAFEKTYKGKKTLDIWLKRWQEKGIIVSYKETTPLLESLYIIEALPEEINK